MDRDRAREASDSPHSTHDTPHPYDPAVLEPKWQRVLGGAQDLPRRAPARPPEDVRARHVPVPVGRRACTSATPRATRRPTSSRATSACAASTCCTRWAGTRSACPPSSTRSRPGTHPRGDDAKNIDNFRAPAQDARLQLRLGRARSTRPIPATCAGRSGSSSSSSSRGLAFQQSDMPVNWCPALGTVLANEEVTPTAERASAATRSRAARSASGCCGSPPTPIACSRISTALDWPETKVKQRDWIGRSEGANVDFAVEGHPDATIAVFTTRADTLVGRDLRRARARARARRADRDARAARRGEARTPTSANAQERHRPHATPTREDRRAHRRVRRSTRSTATKIPIWVADYVIGSYGTGAVMAVPAHDERDFAFAAKYEPPDRRGRRARTASRTSTLEGTPSPTTASRT